MIRVLILLFVLPTLGFCQQDTICLTQDQAYRVYYKLDSLSQVDSLNKLAMFRLDLENRNYQQLNLQNESLLELSNKEVATLKEMLERSLAINQKTIKPESWYNSRVMYFLYGAATIYAGALVVNLIR